jgi:GTP cyclohydrolase I
MTEYKDAEERKLFARANIEHAMEIILSELGVDLSDQHFKDTPTRVAKAYVDELFKGLFSEPPRLKFFDLGKGKDQMVIINDIEFTSMCAHHMLPFMGRIAIGFIPNEKIMGLSKYARVVEYLAARPTVQEDLTDAIIMYLSEHLDPKGMGVYVEAEHTCMSIRGVRKSNKFITTALYGSFYQADVKEEFLRSVK